MPPSSSVERYAQVSGRSVDRRLRCKKQVPSRERDADCDVRKYVRSNGECWVATWIFRLREIEPRNSLLQLKIVDAERAIGVLLLSNPNRKLAGAESRPSEPQALFGNETPAIDIAPARRSSQKNDNSCYFFSDLHRGGADRLTCPDAALDFGMDFRRR
jgi:hypothetical protein